MTRMVFWFALGMYCIPGYASTPRFEKGYQRDVEDYKSSSTRKPRFKGVYFSLQEGPRKNVTKNVFASVTKARLLNAVPEVKLD